MENIKGRKKVCIVNDEYSYVGQGFGIVEISGKKLLSKITGLAEIF